MRTLIVAAIAACLLAGCGQSADKAVSGPKYPPDYYQAAITDVARPQADRDADATRKPGELLSFAQIHSGEKVGDYIMGGGYVTRLLAIAVGSSGKVYAFQPDEFIAKFPDLVKEQADAVAPYPGIVTPLRGPLDDPGFPQQGLDTIITVMNLHDLFLKSWPEGTGQKAIAALYAALKPGGSLIVVDHRAADGAGLAAADAMHRMDEAVAKQMLTSAGFVIEKESDMYANPADPHTASVFDPSIRGHTDKFALRLRKPA